MKTEGRHPEEDAAEARSDDNVVRLPCDWLGPREELVPLAIGGGFLIDTKIQTREMEETQSQAGSSV